VAALGAVEEVVLHGGIAGGAGGGGVDLGGGCGGEGVGLGVGDSGGFAEGADAGAVPEAEEEGGGCGEEDVAGGGVLVSRTNGEYGVIGGQNDENTYPYSLGTVMVTEGVKLIFVVASMNLLWTFSMM